MTLSVSVCEDNTVRRSRIVASAPTDINLDRTITLAVVAESPPTGRLRASDGSVSPTCGASCAAVLLLAFLIKEPMAVCSWLWDPRRAFFLLSSSLKAVELAVGFAELNLPRRVSDIKALAVSYGENIYLLPSFGHVGYVRSLSFVVSESRLTMCELNCLSLEVPRRSMCCSLKIAVLSRLSRERP